MVSWQTKQVEFSIFLDVFVFVFVFIFDKWSCGGQSRSKNVLLVIVFVPAFVFSLPDECHSLSGHVADKVG